MSILLLYQNVNYIFDKLLIFLIIFIIKLILIVIFCVFVIFVFNQNVFLQTDKFYYQYEAFTGFVIILIKSLKHIEKIGLLCNNFINR